ncbi:hypothetical protein WMY93_032183 [Mugilogobius chulae]|uniref:G-protein coupled receptors family 1 profile domain-containing protein n=1 Tax=Mugilogobius chulae TaxID=88201 RepID=A0AAW0MCL5_9GOBI
MLRRSTLYQRMSLVAPESTGFLGRDKAHLTDSGGNQSEKSIKVLVPSPNISDVSAAPMIEECNLAELIDTSWVPPYIYTISALGILLNLLVLLVFLLHKKKCTATEIYLSNMATADLILVTFLPFWGVYEASDIYGLLVDLCVKSSLF